MRSFHRLYRYFIWLSFIFIFLSISIYRLVHIRESKLKTYYRVKQARQSFNQKTKAKKESVRFVQARTGVTRQCWIETQIPDIRREFFIESDTASIQADVKSRYKAEIVEEFQRPKGWYQEELYWEIPILNVRVIPNNDLQEGQETIWYYENDLTKTVEKQWIQHITPKQRIFYFDAVTALWNLITHEVVAHAVSFCIVDLPGHTVNRNMLLNCIVMKGFAKTVTFKIQSNVMGQSITMTGVIANSDTEKM